MGLKTAKKNRSKLKALQSAITTGIESGVSNKSFDQIINQASKELKENRS